MTEQTYIKIVDGEVSGNVITRSNLISLIDEIDSRSLKANGYATVIEETKPELLPWEVLVEDPWVVSEDLYLATKSFSKEVIDTNDFNDDILNSSKQFLLSNLLSLRYVKEISGIEDSNGNLIDTSRESQQKITSTHQLLNSGSLSEPITWKFQGGAWAEYTALEFNDMVSIVADYIQKCYKAEKNAQDIISAYTTLEEVVICDIETLFEDCFNAL